MILAQLHAAHDSLPPWSAYAVITGALCGFLLGAIAMGAFTLRLQRLETFAGSGQSEPAADPAPTPAEELDRAFQADLEEELVEIDADGRIHAHGQTLERAAKPNILRDPHGEYAGRMTRVGIVEFLRVHRLGREGR